MSYSVLLTRMEVEMQSRLVHTDTKNFKKDYNFRAKNINQVTQRLQFLRQKSNQKDQSFITILAPNITGK